jgi:hypothetical protein
MQNVEEQILSYPHLSAERQREIEVYVENHPEWASLLQDVRAIESLARTKQERTVRDPLLTTYVVVQRLHPEGVPTGLEDAFRRLEQKMGEESALRERAESAREHLEAAEAAVDPVAHFEELTPHSLNPDTIENSEAPSHAEQAVADREEAYTEADAPIQRVVEQLLELPLALRWAGAAVALLLGVYVALFAASEASKSTLDRLAAVDVSNQVVDNYASTSTRSALPSPDTLTTDQLYVDALTTLRQARHSTFGLFPNYDAEKLDRAEQLLTRVLDRTESGSFLALEAQFYLGKVQLAQEQVESARSNFKTVVERRGRMAEEARGILEALQKEYPTEERSSSQ